MTHLDAAGAGEGLHRTAVSPEHAVGIHGSGGQPGLAGAESEGQWLTGDADGRAGESDYWLDRLHLDARLRSGDAGRDRVRCGERLRAESVQRGRKCVHAGIAAGEGVVGRQDRQAVGAAEGHGSLVGRYGVGIRILGGDGQVIGGAGRDKRREVADLQLADRRRLDQNGRLGGGNDRRIGQILDRDRLAAGGLERGDEVVDAGIGSGEGIVRRQHRLAVAAREGHSIRKIGSRVAIEVLSSDPEASGHSGGGLVREAGDRKVMRRAGVDRNARLRAGKSANRRIRDRDGLAAGASQRCGEGMNPGIAGGEGVISGQDRLESTAAELCGAGVADVGVAIDVFGRDREAVGGAGRDRGRIAGDDE